MSFERITRTNLPFPSPSLPRLGIQQCYMLGFLPARPVHRWLKIKAQIHDWKGENFSLWNINLSGYVMKVCCVFTSTSNKFCHHYFYCLRQSWRRLCFWPCVSFCLSVYVIKITQIQNVMNGLLQTLLRMLINRIFPSMSFSMLRAFCWAHTSTRAMIRIVCIQSDLCMTTSWSEIKYVGVIKY